MVVESPSRNQLFLNGWHGPRLRGHVRCAGSHAHPLVRVVRARLARDTSDDGWHGQASACPCLWEPAGHQSRVLYCSAPAPRGSRRTNGAICPFASCTVTAGKRRPPAAVPGDRNCTLRATEHRFTIVLVTHDPRDATTLCLSAVVLNAGRVEASGPLDELLGSPKSELLKAFRTQLQPDGEPPAVDSNV